MEFKRMREYTHEEFVELVKSLSEEELLNLSANYGGYPVLFRMSLDERICHIPFIQTGAPPGSRRWPRRRTARPGSPAARG